MDPVLSPSPRDAVITDTAAMHRHGLLFTEDCNSVTRNSGRITRHKAPRALLGSSHSPVGSEAQCLPLPYDQMPSMVLGGQERGGTVDTQAPRTLLVPAGAASLSDDPQVLSFAPHTPPEVSMPCSTFQRFCAPLSLCLLQTACLCLSKNSEPAHQLYSA
ncbi:hypothetical protein H920_08583 [Fukomys damarensis]|uniref:Uncharacterized protein n=1 Tax=Fukomys damarensis TaxID=885580 RepID=A0A091DI63_FUKDA|nr:hypothetical protein H920_08583 [Fukomys damarensis]